MQISSDTTYLFWIYIFLGTSQRSKGCSKINWQSKASTKTKIWSKYARKNATFIIKNAKINQKVWHFKELQSVLIFPRWKSQVKKGSKRSTGCSKIESPFARINITFFIKITNNQTISTLTGILEETVLWVQHKITVHSSSKCYLLKVMQYILIMKRKECSATLSNLFFFKVQL